MSVSNNKRIAKNTGILYLRMLVVMGVSLYTSRIVLNALGVTDFGVYNVVCGVVAMMSFLNGSMSLATQRFLASDLGRNDGLNITKTFSMAINIHVIISLIMIFLAETVGLLLLYYYLKIPAESLNAAFWIFQLSILQTALGIMIVPLQAVVVTHENLKIYAFMSLFEVLVKLVIAFMLIWVNYNKLILYGLLLTGASTISFCIWNVYVYKYYPTCRYRFHWDKRIFREMLSFTGWQTLGSGVYLLRTQGVNFILNNFFGATLNAARGIANQVNTSILHLVTNFQVASNPQITKTYAAQEYEKMRTLILNTSRLSYLLMMLVSIPIFVEAPFILKVWLKNPPEYCSIFVRLILVATLAELLSGTLVFGALACGKVKEYQRIVSPVLFSEVLLVFASFKLGAPPQTIYIIDIFLNCLVLFIRLKLLHGFINLSYRAYIQRVLLKDLGATFVAVSFIYLFLMYIPAHNFYFSCGRILFSFAVGLLSVFIIGLHENERNWILKKLHIK